MADYPLGRIGSCLYIRPGMVRGPGPLKEKREKCFIKTCFSFFYHFQASICIVFMFDVHVFVKQHKLVDLVQYIVLVESIFFVFIV